MVQNYKNSFQEKLEELGDSIVISSNDKFIKSHIHTDYPQKVAKLMDNHCDVLEVKADDMKMQYKLSKKHDNETALVIDSIADFPQ